MISQVRCCILLLPYPSVSSCRCLDVTVVMLLYEQLSKVLDRVWKDSN